MSSHRMPTTVKHILEMSLRSDLQKAVKRLNMQEPKICVQAMCEVGRPKQGRQWLAEHAEFALAYNAILGAEGLPLAQWRHF